MDCAGANVASGHGGPGPYLHCQDGVGQDARLPPALLPQDGSASRIHITSIIVNNNFLDKLVDPDPH
jgi:hypothetical protein